MVAKSPRCGREGSVMTDRRVGGVSRVGVRRAGH